MRSPLLVFTAESPCGKLPALAFKPSADWILVLICPFELGSPPRPQKRRYCTKTALHAVFSDQACTSLSGRRLIR